jgi:GH24 family phage-related lysozyme (muramidase)
LLQDFHPSDAKFDVNALMDILRDRRHEGWVLAAYPDPKTNRPLIGAGFTLDLPAREHPQADALNTHAFIEPSSAELWQAAGLAPDRLQAILDQYSKRFASWKKIGFRRRIATLTPEITNDDADGLLRVSIVQAIYNAKAYCRNFDQLTASQQMAMSQLVYQMGVNLAEFSEFLTLINNGSSPLVPTPITAVAAASDAPQSDLKAAEPALPANGREYWTSVQHSLMQSQWARLYRTRAIAVIAMLDPAYDDSPSVAERQVSAVLRPAVAHRHRGHAASLSKVSSSSSNARGANHKRKAHSHAKRTA